MVLGLLIVLSLPHFKEPITMYYDSPVFNKLSLSNSRWQLCKDLELRGQLEQLKSELSPLEKKHLEIAEKSDRHREIATWGGK